jgi:hypothetical protein
VGDVVAFPVRAALADEDEDAGALDLLSAVDIAIRDLRDILRYWDFAPSRDQANECLQMLKGAYRAALAAEG